MASKQAMRELNAIALFILGAVNLYIYMRYAEVAPYAYHQGHRGLPNAVVGAALVICGFVRLVW